MIYEAILREQERMLEEGYVPTAVRLNSWTVTRLRLEAHKRDTPFKVLTFPVATTVKGGDIQILVTPLGRLVLAVHETMPSDCVILQVNPRPVAEYTGEVEVYVEVMDAEQT